MDNSYDTLLNETERQELFLSRCAFNASEILNLLDEQTGEPAQRLVMLRQFVDTIWKDTKKFAVESIYRWDFVSEYDGVKSTFTKLPEEDPKAWNPDRE